MMTVRAVEKGTGRVRTGRIGGGSGSDGVSPAFQADFTGLTSLPSWMWFSRASNGMVTDNTGKLTYAPNNLLTQSNTFSDTVWTKINITVSNANAVSDPVGGTNASTVTATANSAQILYTAAGAIPAALAAINSIWIKRRTGSGTIQIYQPGATPQTVTVTGAWQQFYTRSAPSGGGTVYLGLILATSGDAVDVYFGTLSAVTYETTPRSLDQVITTSSPYYGPRSDFAWNGSAWIATGLLIEEQRTNLHKSSGDLTTADWGVGGLSRAASSTLSPNGVSFMTEFTSNSGNLANGAALYNSTAIAYTANTVVTISRFFKKSNYDYVFLSLDADVGTAWVTAVFNLSTGLMTQSSQGSLGGTFISASLENVGGGIYRAKLTGSHGSTSGYGTIGFAQAATGNTFDDFGNVVLTGMAGTEKFLAWGAGFEVGTFATSYIPTTTAAVTRSADIVQLTGAALAALQASAGTLFVEIQTIVSGNILPGGRIVGYQNPDTPLYLGSETSVNAYDAVSNPSATLGSGGFSSGARSGFAWDATGFSLAANGGTAVNTGTAFAVSPARADLASNEGVSNFIGVWYRSIVIYSSRLSNADLQAKSVVGASF